MITLVCHPRRVFVLLPLPVALQFAVVGKIFGLTDLKLLAVDMPHASPTSKLALQRIDSADDAYLQKCSR